MCQSHRQKCVCGKRSADIFFGKMVLDDLAIKNLYCPECSRDLEADESRVWDNGWVLELDMDVVRYHAKSMGMAPGEITADWIFDEGYATWVGITPDEADQRNRERAEIQKLARTDFMAYYKAMRQWGLDRQARFSREGWRKMGSGIHRQ